MTNAHASTTLTRRGFVAGAAATAGAALTATAALADEAESGTEEDAGSDTEEAPVSSETPAWLGTAPEISEDQIAETVDCDVLVIGYGTSGLFGACSAAENGAKVLVLEKNESGPGIRGTLGAIGTKYQLEDDCDIKATDICREMTMYSASNVNTKLLRLWADNSAETIEWYGDLCVEAGREFGYTADHDLDDVADSMCYRHWATGHSCLVDGRTSEDGTVLIDHATELGVEVRYSTPMVKLEQDESGRVTGAIAQNADGTYLRANAAKGVLVCTGGYALNDDMMSALQAETKLTFSHNSGIPGAEGDGIKACLWAGAAFDEVHTSMLFDRCPLSPDMIAGEEMVDGMFWMGS